MLNFDKAHKEEEAALRQIFDKKHIDEQIAFRRARMEKNHKLKKDLFGDEVADEERKTDQKALDNFLAVKKAEQEKRQKATEAEKRQLAKDFSKKLDDKIADHEDLLKRKRDAALEAANKASDIRKRLNERKKKLADKNFAGLTDEEKAEALRQAMARYESLGFTYADEK